MWLEPYGVAEDRSALEARSSVVAGLTASDALDAQTLVAAAHHYWPDGVFEAVVDACAKTDPSLVLTNKRPLTATLAAAAVFARLDAIDGAAAESVSGNRWC